MDQIVSLCATVVTKWQGLVSSRAGEVGLLDAAIGQSNSFGYYSTTIAQWHAKLSSFSKLPKRRVSNTTQIQNALKRNLSAINYALDGMGNGIQWLIDNRSFSVLLLLAESQMDLLEREVQKDRATQVEAAKTQLADDLEMVERGAGIVRELLEQSKDLQKSASLAVETIEVAVAKKGNLEKEFEGATDKIKTLYSEVEKENKDSRTNLLKDIAQIKSKAEQSYVDLSTLTREKQEAVTVDIAALNTQVTQAKDFALDISGFHSKALAASNDATIAKENAQADLSKATTALVESDKKLEAAKLALNAALQNVRRQGLSGAFFEKVGEVQSQRDAEQKRFQAALFYLAVIGVLGLVMELIQGVPTTIDQWLIRFVRLLVLAAPGVWIAWLAAKRLEALNRVLSDYEYKSATALAFESYRQEIETSGNADLKEELLRRAVITFGENPTRFYDSSKDISVMPAESMWEKLKGFVPATQPSVPVALPVVEKPVIKAITNAT